MPILYNFRTSKGWTAKECAEKLNISKVYLYKLEDGSRNITVDLAEQLSGLSGIDTMSWLRPDKYGNPYL